MYIVILREPSENNAKMYSLKANKGNRLEYYKKRKKKINPGDSRKRKNRETKQTKKNRRHIAKDSKVIELYPSYQLSFKIYMG